MKILLDANVLFPTVMREVLLGVASQGLFTPFWSERILEEWARAAAKLGPGGEAQARGEIALLKAAWPKGQVAYPAEKENRFWLPDPGDIHVLAAAEAAHADAIMTMNAKDFPRHILAEEGLARVDPDGYLFQCWQTNPRTVESVAARVLAQARHMSGEDWTMRGLLKKARMPRLGRALDG